MTEQQRTGDTAHRRYRVQAAAELSEHAAEEMRHGMWAAERVSQLGGEPGFNPPTLKPDAATPNTSRSTRPISNACSPRTWWPSGSSSAAISRSSAGSATPIRPPAALMKRILQQEEEHADDLSDLLGN